MMSSPEDQGVEDLQESEQESLHQSIESHDRLSSNRLLPCETPPEKYPKPTWKPIVLTTSMLISATVFTALCLASVIILGVFHYIGHPFLHARQEYSYFAVRYLPTLVGSISKIWMQSIFLNLGWMAPYIAMSRDNEPLPGPENSIFATYYSGRIALGEVLHNREWLLAGFWFTYTTIALFLPSVKASFLSATPDTNGWVITVTPWATLALIAMYTMQLSLLTATCVKLTGKSFGLLNSVASVADQVNLVAQSNVLDDINGFEWGARWLWREHLQHVRFRLGYWNTTADGQVWYGIGAISDPEATSATERPKAPNDGRVRNVTALFQHPIMIITSTVISSFLTALLGYIMYISSLASTTQLFVNTSSLTLVNIFVRFLPAFFTNYYSLYWINADRWFRRVQVFASMSTPATAEKSLFLEYPYDLPVVVTLNAVKNGHRKVAWFSLLSLSASLLPTLVGGIFTAKPNIQSGFDITIAPTSLIGTFILLALYSLSFPWAWHTHSRRFPMNWLAMGDIIAMCYRSYILNMPAFAYPASDDQRIHMQSRIYLAKAQYAFGTFVGTDGEKHVGFDVASLEVGDGQFKKHVQPLEPEDQRIRGWFAPRRRRPYARVDDGEVA
ncbi:hypothetical protein MBLNU459_g8399t1 [Dothideomycetes sp. NU459]